MSKSVLAEWYLMLKLLIEIGQISLRKYYFFSLKVLIPNINLVFCTDDNIDSASARCGYKPKPSLAS